MRHWLNLADDQSASYDADYYHGAQVRHRI